MPQIPAQLFTALDYEGPWEQHATLCTNDRDIIAVAIEHARIRAGSCAHCSIITAESRTKSLQAVYETETKKCLVHVETLMQDGCVPPIITILGRTKPDQSNHHE